MTFRDVYIVSDKRDLATDDEVATAERAFGVRLPAGYREYVTVLGAGQLNDAVRLVLPSEMVDRTKEFWTTRKELAAFGEEHGSNFWDGFEEGLDLLPPERMLTAILLGKAHDNNYIVAHPDAPDDLFLIDDTAIFAIGHSVEEAIHWILEGEPYGDTWRVLTADGQFAKRPVRYFEPDRDRAQLSFGLTADVPFAEVRDHLVTLARQQPGATFLVSQVFPDEEDEAIEHEIVQFFAREYGGPYGAAMSARSLKASASSLPTIAMCARRTWANSSRSVVAAL